MPTLSKVDRCMDANGLEHELRDYGASARGNLSITLVRRTVQSYNLVMHPNIMTLVPKVRLALVGSDGLPGSSLTVSDIVEKVFGDYSKTDQILVEATLKKSEGSIRVTIRDGRIERVDFHYGELWP